MLAPEGGVGVPMPPRDALTPPSLATPSTTSDTLSPSLITRETSPADQAADADANANLTASTSNETSSSTAPPTSTTSIVNLNPSTTAATATTTTVPTVPTLHLLTDPTNTQHYLLIGPHAQPSLGQLPLDILYPLLATGLPHDQLVRDFQRATNEMVRALQRADFRSALNLNFPLTSILPSGSVDKRVSSNMLAPWPSDGNATKIICGYRLKMPANT